MRMKLLLLGTVIGTLGFLTSAHADETWNFNAVSGPLGLTENYAGTAGTIITVTAFGPSANLFGKNIPDDDIGLGLTNNRANEIIPGSFIQLDLSNINFAVTPVILFEAFSTTNGDTWQIYKTNTPGTAFGPAALADNATFVDSCASEIGSGISNPCEGVFTINGLGGFRFLDLTAAGQDATSGEPGTVLLSGFSAVPGPIVGAGLPGLIAMCGGLIAFARRRRRQ